MRVDRLLATFLLIGLFGCQSGQNATRTESEEGGRVAKIAASTDTYDASADGAAPVTRTETYTQTATDTKTATITVPTTVTEVTTKVVTTTSSSVLILTQNKTETSTGIQTVPTTVTVTQSSTATATGTANQTKVLTYQQSYSLSGVITSTNTATVYYASWAHKLGTTATATTTQITSGTASRTLTQIVTSSYSPGQTKVATAVITGSGTATGVQTVTVHATATATSTNAGTGSKTLTATGTASGTATQSWTYHPTMVVTNTVTNTGTRTGTGTKTSTTSSTYTSSSTYTQSQTSSKTDTATDTGTTTGTGTSVGTDTTIVTQTLTNTLIVCGATGQACQASEYCQFDDGACHLASGVGVCRSKPGACAGDPQQVCGCDGQTYDSPCKAAMAGATVDYAGACDNAPPTISLSVSATLLTAAGTLTLTAIASDDLAVTKVELFQDDVSLGSFSVPPYTLDVAVTDALNGRHTFKAVAVDTRDHSASDSKRVLIAIGNKFFGTAVTTAADYTNLLAHFNQVTPGNAGKWGTVEPVQGQMTFTDLDTAYQFAKDNHIPFKLHTLVWGQQQPSWVASLSTDQQLAAVDNWMATLAARYPDVQMIDVVNEPTHTKPSYAAALGGDGATGWDWVIKAFQMARAHFPKAELILNDYQILPLASFTANYLQIVNLLKDRGLIDGIGEQGHFYERSPDLSVLSTNLATLAATGLPIYISELDVNFADDARQANRMAELFSTFWSNPSVLGITHWGYLQGNMWQTNAYLIRSDGTLRPALTWIECYEAGGTDCPLPVYVPPPRTGDANGITLEAEDYDNAHGLLTAGSMVAYASDGSWFEFDKVTFDDNWNTLSVAYALGGGSGINLTVHLGSLDNAPVATVPLAATGDWTTMKTVSIPWVPVTGAQNLYVRFNGGGANVDKIQIGAPSGTGKNLITDSDFEQGTTGNWWTWVSHDSTTNTIVNTTARALSGTHALAMTGRTGNSPLVAPSAVTGAMLPGKTYKVSLWATVGGTTSDSTYVTTVTQCSTDTSPTYGRLGGWSNSKVITDGTWVELAGDFAIPDCTLSNVGLWLEGPGVGVDLYIDHVSIRQQSSTNIIPNGTFESGSTGWFSWSGGQVSASSARAHGGSKSLLVTGRSNNGPAATDLTSLVKAGTNYPFSLWVSAQSTGSDTTNPGINVTQAATCQGASAVYTQIGGPVSAPDGSGWVQITGTVAVPSCTVTQLLFYVQGGAGADLYVDDVQVIDSSLISNLIGDGTFESGQGAWGGWGYTTLGVTSSLAHTGQQSLLGTGMQSNGGLGRDIKSLVQPGQRYQASAWVSVANLTSPPVLAKFQTIQACNGGSTSYPWLGGANLGNGGWTQLTGTVDLSACTSIQNLVLFVGADTGDLYVDDVVLKPIQ